MLKNLKYMNFENFPKHFDFNQNFWKASTLVTMGFGDYKNKSSGIIWTISSANWPLEFGI